MLSMQQTAALTRQGLMVASPPRLGFEPEVWVTYYPVAFTREKKKEEKNGDEYITTRSVGDSVFLTQ